MPDVFSKAKRSEVMSRIRSRGNQDTELRLVAVFRALGITGWRRQVALSLGEHSTLNAEHRTLKRRREGKNSIQDSKLNAQGSKFVTRRVRPDFVFRRARLAVFVDGCFWHGCAEHYRRPTGNRQFWDAKIARNMARDALVTKALKKAGWRVLRLWEHELTQRREARLAVRLRRWGLGRIEDRR